MLNFIKAINPGTVKQAWKVSKKYVIKNAPKILTIIGVAAMGASTVHAIAVSPKAKAEVDEIEQDEDLTHKEYLKKKTLTYLKYYWPEFILVFGGGACVFGAQHINAKRITAISAALATQTDKLEKLQNVIKSEDGEKKLEKYQDKVAQEDVKAHAQGLDMSTVYNTGKGNTLMFDPIGKRFFLSDLEFIKREAEEFAMEIARQMQHGEEAVQSLNDWYETIHLPPLDGQIEVGGRDIQVGPNIGKDLGWRNRMMRLQITSGMLENDQTYFVIGFKDGFEPKLDPNICDDYGSSYSSRYGDDETDMPWRG